MKVCLGSIQFGLAFVIFVAAGCDGINLELAVNDSPEPKTGTPPIAVLSIAPTQQWFAHALSLTKNSDEPTTLSDDQLQKQFPGIDNRRPTAAFLYLSSHGIVEPLIYLPVDDYERFLNELDRRFPMKRAIASRFKCGPYQLLVMQVGEYAAIGTSMHGIKKGPNSPEPYLQELPEGFDFVFKWHPDSTDKRERMKLVGSIRDSFGKTFAQLVSKTDSFVCGLKVDSISTIGFQALIKPVPENSHEVQALLDNMFAAQDLTASTEIKEDHLKIDVAIDSDKANSTWAKIQPAVTRFFKSQLAILAKRSSKSSGLQRVHDSAGTSVFGGAFISGSSSGGSSSGGQKRRG